jgi:type I restriction enzyme S subunit
LASVDPLQINCIADCLREVTEGVGNEWQKYPVLGATRAGLAPAKEPVGKNPGRYKPVRPGTIFYNPMRILLGSIAMLDEDDAPGITSPDYVAMTAVDGRLSARWFYYWFRSQYGAEFIKSMTRGAVRERLMFKRLAPASIILPDWEHQKAADRQFIEIKKAKTALTASLRPWTTCPPRYCVKPSPEIHDMNPNNEVISPIGNCPTQPT